MEERILTLHPQGKKGTHILKSKYDLVKDCMLKHLAEHGEITYQLLNEIIVDELSTTFDGAVVWYVVTVKLDLEARGIIERIPKTSPHQVRLKSAK